jgi:hypothetical protein
MATDLTLDMDVTAVLAALAKLGTTAQLYVNRASKETANAIVSEARKRLARQLGPDATGRTAASLVVRPAFDGNGVVVIAERDPMPDLPLWLEKGTRRGMGPRPYFYTSAVLEEGAHFRRIETAVQDAIDAQGLGD